MKKNYPFHDGLIAHLLNFMDMPECFADLLRPHLTPLITYHEDTLVLRPNETAQMAYWPVRGYMRFYSTYYPKADSMEMKQQTIDISCPERICLASDSFMNRTPVDFYCEICKGSAMIGFSYDSFMELGKEIPEVGMLASKIVGAANTEWHKKNQMCKVNGTKGYKDFLAHFGKYVESYIFQKHIASFIGRSPERLSRIRTNGKCSDCHLRK
jgi:hypothetical protein